MAEYRFDDGDWMPNEEILIIDNLFRERLGWPQRMETFAQPWVNPVEETPEHKITLRYTLQSDLELSGLELAMEEAETAYVSIDGKRIEKQITGFFTDHSIRCIRLPDISPGKTLLEIELPFTRRTNLEWCYLLGDFGVTLSGCTAKLTAPVRALSFRDYCTQGLPFYAGNVIYHLDVEVTDGDYALNISKYRAPLLKVSVDNVEKGNLVFAPYTLELGHLSAGRHRISITSYGNRVNAFGTVHNCDDKTT